MALRRVEEIYFLTGGKIPIIGCGGIRTAEDAWQMMAAGANAVQGLTGFVYHGPSWARDLNLGLLQLMDERGVKKVSDIVGSRQRV